MDAVEAYLERIERVDGKLSSYIIVCGEHALEAARHAEDAIARGEYRGPLHGIPVAVKDQFYTKDILTTGGSTILANLVPDEDATVISKLKAAGAVLLGKLNMSEFAMGNSFHHPFGTPRNPWDLERNPGTSSSGSGVATAALLCATSLGEDTGGSIRNPASACGIVGLRPSQGRVSRYGMLGAIWSMDTAGPLSRTVEDCAITLQAIAGHDPKDPYTWDAPVPEYTKALDGEVAGVRIGVITEKLDSIDMHPDVKESVGKAVGLLSELGASVQNISLPLIDQASVIFTPIFEVEYASVHGQRIPERLKDYDHNVRVRLLSGSVMPSAAYYRAQKLRTVLRRQILEALERVDVLVLATSSTPAQKLPASAGVKSVEEVRAGYFGSRNFRTPFNLAGVPAISVPCGFTSSGPTLPIGLQIIGRPFEEGMVMKVAHAYERNTARHTRRPPV